MNTTESTSNKDAQRESPIENERNTDNKKPEAPKERSETAEAPVKSHNIIPSTDVHDQKKTSYSSHEGSKADKPVTTNSEHNKHNNNR